MEMSAWWLVVLLLVSPALSTAARPGLSCWVCGCPAGTLVSPDTCSGHCKPGSLGEEMVCPSGACKRLSLEHAGTTNTSRFCLSAAPHEYLASKGRAMNSCTRLEVMDVVSTECYCDTYLCNLAEQTSQAPAVFILTALNISRLILA